MIFLDKFNFTLKLFYLTGLRPELKSTAEYKLIDGIIVLTTSTLCVGLTIYLTIVPHFPSIGIIYSLIYYLHLPLSLVMMLCGNGQCYFAKNVYQIIINQIEKLEKRFDEATLKVSFERLAVQFRLKVVILYALFFLSQTLVFVEIWRLDPVRAGSSFLISLIRATYPWMVLHFVLYIDIAAMFFHKLNVIIQQSPIIVHKSGKIDFLKYVKLVHSDLLKMIVAVNKFFGWNLLFTSIFWFIYITHQVYWIFLNMQKFDMLHIWGEWNK